MTTAAHAQWYRPVDAALLRASVHTADVVPRPWPNTDAEIERWCVWLGDAWSQAPVAAAVAVASPALAARVAAVCAGQRPGAVQVRRMVLSVARYLVRMRGRATPFGAFAGVAAMRFGDTLVLGWNDRHHLRARADAVWLAEVVARLETCHPLLTRLPVVVNDLAAVLGERVVVRWQPHAGGPRDGRRAAVEVSLRRSTAVQAIMGIAQAPIVVGRLLGKVQAEFPAVTMSTIDAVVMELVLRGLLISSLRPPSTSTDGLAHVLEQVNSVDAAEVPQVAELTTELREIHALLQATGREAGCADERHIRLVQERMRSVVPAVEQPLMVDLRLGGAMVLPTPVAAEAASAVAALVRLAPPVHPGWRDYRRRFVERYGFGAVVAVEDLVDAVSGLGYPGHYAEHGRVLPVELSPRDERLLALAQRAAWDDALEVVLDDASLDELADGAGEQTRHVPHVDVCVEIRAATTAALTDGAFTLSITGVGRTAMATAGRFLDLLPDTDRQQMADEFRRLPVGVQGAVPAQLSFPPSRLRAENVLRAPAVLARVIAMAEHRNVAPGTFPVQDLAVTADAEGMYVLSLSRRCVVEPVLPHAAAPHTMPALARLLFELPRVTSTPPALFHWGASATLPFRPRIRYRRSILALARWRLDPADLPGSTSPRGEWASAMAGVRRRMRLPASVSVGTGDRRLRLDLDDPMDLALLRDHLDATGDVVTVSEAPTAADHGWFDGRAHEVVIPLASATPPAPPPAVVTRSGPLPLIRREHAHLPGSRILFAKIGAHPDVMDTILTRHLPSLLTGWNQAPPWWFVRYRHPSPHVRLRLNDVTDYGSAAARIGAWAAELRRRGLIGDLTLDTYHPETARYGSGDAMAAAEALFAADSAAAVGQLTASAAAPEVHPHALTAASLVDLACAMTGSQPAGMRWLIEHPDLAGRTSVGDRAVLRQALHLADTADGRAHLRAIPGGDQIAICWHERRQVATRYAACLTATDTGVTPDTVLVSLLHLHHVRAHGIDPDTEALTHRLARAIALAWNFHHTAAEDNPR